MTGGIWMEVASAAINYIVVSTISSASQKQTVTDLKTDLRTTKEDLMAELKDSRQNLLQKADETKGSNNGS